MVKAVQQAYFQLKTLYDPAMEGSPYDGKKQDVKVKSRDVYRYHAPKLTKQFIVR